MVERRKLPFKRKKPPSEPGRGQERGDNRHHNTRSGIPAEKDKHEFLTTMMSCVHGE